MFGNVIIGVDGSPTGRDAIALAAVLAEPDARLVLAHVRTGEHKLRRGPLADDARSRDDVQQLLETERSASAVRAELASISAPSVGRGLHALAEQNDADLLVVGSCQRGVFGRVLVGDDTRAALNGAPCAVAVAPRGYLPKPGGLASIGIAYDFSAESDVALAAARQLAQRDAAPVRALYVVPPSVGFGLGSVNWGEILKEERRYAQQRVDSLEGVAGSAVFGVIGEELAQLGDHVDLLVVGSRNYGPARRLILGSTSNYLARHARCALLMVPRTATADGDVEIDQHDADDATLARIPKQRIGTWSAGAGWQVGLVRRTGSAAGGRSTTGSVLVGVRRCA